MVVGKQKRHLEKAREKSKASTRTTDEARALHAALPPLVLQGPKHLLKNASRPAKPRTARRIAERAWARCGLFFDRLGLVAEPGDYDTPENDYGGLISTLSFESADEQKDADGPVGLLVRGVPACKKKGQSKEHIPENSKGHMAVLYALLLSCANIPFFGYFSRFAAIRGANTKWHTDANTLFVKQSRESASSSRR